MTSREFDVQAAYEAVVAVRRSRAERNAHMKELRRREWTLDAIGKMYGLSRQRVHQILNDEESHLFKPPKPKRAHRKYTKHDGQIPHGTVVGYTYGCHKSSPCPAKPTCAEERAAYMRRWVQKRKERKAFDV